MIVSDKVERLKQAGFTSEEIGLLTKMEQGDTNNKKGHFYEKCFTVFQVLKFTNQKNIENSTVLISNDESLSLMIYRLSIYIIIRNIKIISN